MSHGIRADGPILDALARSISYLRAALEIADNADLPMLGAKISEALDLGLRELEARQADGAGPRPAD